MNTGRPNILMIMTDQQRWDSLGCYGADWVQTPNLDALGRDGVIFDNCYVNNPICTPSRSSIWTGRELPGHGVYRLYDNLPHDQVHFPKVLQEAGYRTALYGKLHTSGRLFEAYQRHPNDGFHEYEWGLEASIHLDSPFNGYSRWLQANHPKFYAELSEKGRNLLNHPRECHFTHWAAERTIDFIRRSTAHQAGVAGAPFFCCMSVFDPHNPYEDFPLEILDRVDAGRIPPPLRDPRRDRPSGVEREREHSYLGGFDSFSEDDLRAIRVGYYASIALIDLEVGRVLDALEEAGVAENTLVLFVSDHGDMIGDHDLVVKGAYFYDACSKVPFLIRWPAAIPPSRRIEALVQPHDIAATVLAAAGHSETPGDAPEGRRKDPGRQRRSSSAGTGGEASIDDSIRIPPMPTSQNLIPLAQGKTERVRDYAVCAYRNSGISDTKRPWDPPIYATMIHDGRYKLSLYHGTREGELYDMQADPDELDDLIQRPEAAPVRQRMTDALVEWLSYHEIAGLGSRGGERLPGPADQLDNTFSSTNQGADR